MSQLLILVDRCRRTISDGNLESCFDFLEASLVNRARLDELLILKGNLNRAKHSQSLGLSNTADQVSANTSFAILEMLNKLTEEDINPINPINGRILILSPESKVSDWKQMFSDQNFSHAYVIYYGQDIPLDYRRPEVVVFDDTGPNVRPHMVQLAGEMPDAHFLYFGDLNPFTESRKRSPVDAAIFERCANANSKFTVHARLRELLEFRKVYGVPTAIN